MTPSGGALIYTQTLRRSQLPLLTPAREPDTQMRRNSSFSQQPVYKVLTGSTETLNLPPRVSPVLSQAIA